MAFVLDRRIARSTLLGLATVMACKGNGEESSIYSEAGSGLSADAGTGETGGSGETGDTGGQECGECQGTMFTPCENGAAGEPIDCFLQDLVCVDQLGCLPCVPGQDTCQGNDVYTCTDTGEPGELVEECDSEAGEVCSNGTC